MKSVLFTLTLTCALNITATAKSDREVLYVDAALDRPTVVANQQADVVLQIKIRPERIVSNRG
ncbi:MAG: hypothetical protein GVY36_02320 [Verrucomicrobia bacterium]|jgi:hypothetical protein|nr:hypothetical protein [Verrucomicrobiota bacterium]